MFGWIGKERRQKQAVAIDYLWETHEQLMLDGQKVSARRCRYSALKLLDDTLGTRVSEGFKPYRAGYYDGVDHDEDGRAITASDSATSWALGAGAKPNAEKSNDQELQEYADAYDEPEPEKGSLTYDQIRYISQLEQVALAARTYTQDRDVTSLTRLMDELETLQSEFVMPGDPLPSDD